MDGPFFEHRGELYYRRGFYRRMDRQLAYERLTGPEQAVFSQRIPPRRMTIGCGRGRNPHRVRGR